MDDLHHHVNRLSELRARLGGGIVDELIRSGQLTSAPLSEGALALAEKILRWEPSTQHPFHGMLPAAKRLADEQLLSDNLPQEIEELAIRLRQASQDAEHDDPVLASLLSLAARVYPAFLSWSSYENIDVDTPTAPIVIRGVPELRLAIDCLTGEFPFSKWGEERFSHVLTTFGDLRYGLVLHTLPSLILNGAWRLCLLRGSWTTDNFASAIGEQLQRIRDAHATGKADAPVFCGIGNVKIKDEISFENIIIRPYVGGFQDGIIIPSSRFQEDKGLEPGVIVEARYPWEFSCVVRRDEGDEKETEAGPSHADWADLRRWLDCLAVAAVASGVGERISAEQLREPVGLWPAPAARWIYPADPLSVPTSFHFSVPWPGSDDVTTIDSKTFVWLKTFLAIKDGPFNVALRRIRSALTVPRLWEDALVDAVIAWEALSGEYRQAVTKMIAAVLAKLIAEQKHRREIRRILEKTYGIRNRVVHGADIEDYEEVKKAKERAILVAVIAVKQLAKNHADLIGKKDLFDRFCLD